MKKTTIRLIALSILLTGLAAIIGCNREQAPAAAPSIEIPKDEIKTSGDWTYRIIITQPGTRSQGRLGELLYKGTPLPVPSINDYVETPWGKIYWHGLSIEDGLMIWNDQGWMQEPRSRYDIGQKIVWPQNPASQKTTL
jgi:hypothetical protein